MIKFEECKFCGHRWWKHSQEVPLRCPICHRRHRKDDVYDPRALEELKEKKMKK